MFLVTTKHHYRTDIFTFTIDQQLKELNNRFSEQTIELLMLSTTLDPRNTYTLFNVKIYPGLLISSILKTFLTKKKPSWDSSGNIMSFMHPTHSSKIKKVVINCWFMPRISRNWKINNLFTNWQNDLTYFDSFVFWQ